MDIKTFLVIFLSILLSAALLASGYLYWQLETTPAPLPIPAIVKIATPTPVENDTSIEIELFYLTMDHNQFVIELRRVLQADTISGRIRRAIEELLNTQKTPANLIAPIPEGTQLQSVIWSDSDNCVYISFSKELIENNPGHALSEWAAIYCIVNTAAAQSTAIEDVQILVDGETIDNPTLNWDWSRPFQPDFTFVRYSTAQSAIR